MECDSDERHPFASVVRFELREREPTTDATQPMTGVFVMGKLKMLAAAGLATGALAVGGLGVAPSASAMPRDCDSAMAVADAYFVYARLLIRWGEYNEAAIWLAKGNTLVNFACGPY